MNHITYLDLFLEREYWGSAGAGCVFYCPDTGRLLLAHRSEDVMEPGTWGVWGGRIEPNESPEQAMRREVREETEYTGDFKLKVAYVFTDEKFKYTTYVAFVDKEFKPELDWETQGYRWCKPDDMPGDLHFGLEAALPGILKII